MTKLVADDLKIDHNATIQGNLVVGGNFSATTLSQLSTIIFRPGGVASGNVYTSAAAVAAALTAANGAVTVYIDTSLGAATIPAGVTWNMGGVGSVIGSGSEASGDEPPTTLTIADTAQIRNPFKFENLTFICACVTLPSFDYDASVWAGGPDIVFGHYVFFDLGSGSPTIPPFTVPVAALCPQLTVGLIGTFGEGFLTYGGTVALFKLTSGGVSGGGVVVLNALTAGPFPANLFSGDSSTGVALYADASSWPLPSWTGFTGGVAPHVMLDVAAGVAYTPTTTANWTSQPTTAQAGLDNIAAQTKLFSLNVTLTSGTAIVASGKNLTNATVIGVYLKTATTAVGVPTVTFVAGANGNVTVTSKSPSAATLTTDASTYTVVFAGAV